MRLERGQDRQGVKLAPKDNPVIWLTLVGPITAVLVAAGVGLSAELVAASAALAETVGSILARSQVTPVERADARARNAYARGVCGGRPEF